MFSVCDVGAGVLPAVSDKLPSKLKGKGDDNLVDAGIGRPDSQVNFMPLQHLGEDVLRHFPL